MFESIFKLIFKSSFRLRIFNESFIATFISIFAGLFKAGALLIVGITLLSIVGGESVGDNKILIVIFVILAILGILTDKLAVFTAKKVHKRKLHKNLNYTLSYVAIYPEAHEYCLENNQKYREYYNENGSKMETFDPNEFRPE